MRLMSKTNRNEILRGLKLRVFILKFYKGARVCTLALADKI